MLNAVKPYAESPMLNACCVLKDSSNLLLSRPTRY